MRPEPIARWIEIAKSGEVAALHALLAEDVVFQSPVVHTPQKGRVIAAKYLAAAIRVLGNSTFRYIGEWHGADSAVLEFTTVIEGVEINGVDIIGWNAAGEIASFKVMVRPLKAMQALHQQMGAVLAS